MSANHQTTGAEKRSLRSCMEVTLLGVNSFFWGVQRKENPYAGCVFFYQEEINDQNM